MAVLLRPGQMLPGLGIPPLVAQCQGDGVVGPRVFGEGGDRQPRQVRESPSTTSGLPPSNAGADDAIDGRP